MKLDMTAVARDRAAIEAPWTLEILPDEQFNGMLEWNISTASNSCLMGNTIYYPYVPDEVGYARLIAQAPTMADALLSIQSILAKYEAGDIHAADLADQVGAVLKGEA